MDHGTYNEHQEYCVNASSTEPALLQELRRATHLRCIHPRMASGPYLGRTLALLSKMIKPKRILEIGTFTGYSALCLAEGLESSGELITIEKNDELESIQKEFFSKSEFDKQIRPIIGDAFDILQTLDGPFQLIFLDADKENYTKYLQQLLLLSQNGTIILIDNMLWEGKVLFEDMNDPQTNAIKELTEKIKNDKRLEQILLPIRDGLLMVRVNSDNDQSSI
ncbi:MAG: methyltransferase [Flavobacteriales bacterium]|nr:methyltransferase [Flavobacteriales bacterium]